jgi:hypothetical protein
VDKELPLFDSVTYPVKVHVNGFGSILLNGFIFVGVAACVTHFYERSANWDGISDILEHGGKFDFGGGGHVIKYNTANGMDGAIMWWQFGSLAVGDGVLVGFELMKKVPPARLLAWASER